MPPQGQPLPLLLPLPLPLLLLKSVESTAPLLTAHPQSSHTQQLHMSQSQVLASDQPWRPGRPSGWLGSIKACCLTHF